MRVKATDLQNSFGKYLALVEKEDIVITKNGKSVAKLIPYKDPYDYILREQKEQYNPQKRATYEEYKALVEKNEKNYELIDGEIFLLSSPGYYHQVVVNEIAGQFYNFFKNRSCSSLTSPLDVKLSGYAIKFEEDPNVVQPDIMVICDEENISENNEYEGTPSLIVEVLSPSTKRKDQVLKLNLYMKSGVQEYWIVDLEKKIIFQYCFNQERNLEDTEIVSEDETLSSPTFPDLEISTGEVFSQVRKI